MEEKRWGEVIAGDGVNHGLLRMVGFLNLVVHGVSRLSPRNCGVINHLGSRMNHQVSVLLSMHNG